MSGAFVQVARNSANAAFVNISPAAGNALVFAANTSAGGGSPTVTALQAMSAVGGAGSVLASFTIPTALATTSYLTGSFFGTSGYLLALPAGVASVLATFNGGTPGTCLLQVSEHSGLSAYLNGARQFQAGPGTTTDALSSGVASLASIPAYLVGIVSNGTGDADTVAGTGFTIRGTVTNNWALEDRRETGATGSYAATATAPTHGATDDYITTVLMFSEPGGIVEEDFYLPPLGECATLISLRDTPRRRRWRRARGSGLLLPARLKVA